MIGATGDLIQLLSTAARTKGTTNGSAVDISNYVGQMTFILNSAAGSDITEESQAIELFSVATRTASENGEAVDVSSYSGDINLLLNCAPVGTIPNEFSLLANQTITADTTGTGVDVSSYSGDINLLLNCAPVGTIPNEFSLLANQTITADTTGTGVDVSGYSGDVYVILSVKAGGNDSLDVKIQKSEDNSTWEDISGAAFDQVTSSASLQMIKIASADLDKYIRAYADVGGETPSYTLSVTGFAYSIDSSATLDVKIQKSEDNSTWEDISGAAFDQVTSSASLQMIKIASADLDKYIRAYADVGGETPSYTLSVTGFAYSIDSSATLDVKIQTSENGSSWNDIDGAAFTQVTDSAAREMITIAEEDREKYIRAVATIDGTAPAYAFSVMGAAITQTEAAEAPTLDVKIQESADNSTWTNITGGVFDTVEDSASYQRITLNVDGLKKYVKAVAIIDGTNPEFEFSVQALGIKQYG